MSAIYNVLSQISMYYVPLPCSSFLLQVKIEQNDLFPLSEGHCSLTTDVSVTVLLFVDFSNECRFKQPVSSC